LRWLGDDGVGSIAAAAADTPVAGFLIAARAVHYAATMSLAGIFAFFCLVLAPQPPPRLQRQLPRLAAASLALALVTGAAWLVLVSARISGQPVVTALTQGAAATVLSRTRFGQVWSGRFVLMLALTVLLALPPRWRGRWWRWGGLGLAAGALAALAWAGHGGATPGWPGVVHLVADMLHLLAAGAWIGALLPLALWLGEGPRPSPERVAAIGSLVARFSRLAAICAGLVFAAGLVNTWFLAGTVPALIGTLYGRLLLAKIGIFLIIIAIASVNLLRFARRLAGPDAARLVPATLGHLRRNAITEAVLGFAILGIVAGLGTLPPGLHSEAGWPLPFRLELAAIGPPAKAALGAAGALAIMFAAAGVASAAAGRYRRALVAGAGVVALAMLGAIVVRPGIEPAYPTSFYAPAEPYAAASVAHGARVYAGNCAICHGAGGKGDGPAAVALAVRPANLTAPHLLAHTPGDLFWWVSNGKGGGAMPGFAVVLSAADRWDVINFIRARAAGTVARSMGPKIIAAAAPRLPDFAFEENGRQQTLDRMLSSGPALIALFAAPPPRERLAWLAAARSKLEPLGLQIVAVDLTPGQAVQLETPAPAPLAAVAADVAGTLALFRSADDGGETDLLLDRAGEVRARWAAAGGGGAADIRVLADQADRIRQFPAAAAGHSGHAH
jgi:putative copper export protein/mono/diheme cytochrome c family protein